MSGLFGMKWGVRKARPLNKLEEDMDIFDGSDLAEARRMEEAMCEAYIRSKLEELKRKREEDEAIKNLFIAVIKNDEKAIGDACDAIKAMNIIDTYK